MGVPQRLMLRSPLARSAPERVMCDILPDEAAARGNSAMVAGRFVAACLNLAGNGHEFFTIRVLGRAWVVRTPPMA